MSVQEPQRSGGQTRSVAVLMASTFLAALAFVAAAVAIGGFVRPDSQPTFVSVHDAVVARVDAEIVDINTVLVNNDGLAAGTGMVLTSNGEVLTNNHVIQQASSISATDVGNGHSYQARVIGYDEKRDIAVLQLIGAYGLASVALGDSAGIGQGTHVVTIGNAGGAGGTPSAHAGTVLARDQAINVADDLDGSSEDLSQLLEIRGDLQPGDSGGPMITGSGEVVGMDTAAGENYEFSAGNGFGFALEVDPVRQVANEIIARHATSAIHIGPTAYIGVLVEPQSQYSGPPGALIERAVEGTPAAGAGIEPGDLIVALGNRQIGSAQQLTQALVPYHPGDRVTISWLTLGGVHRSATIALASGPAG